MALKYRDLLLLLLSLLSATGLPESKQTWLMLHVLKDAQRKFCKAALRYKYGKDFQIFSTILHADKTSQNKNSVLDIVEQLGLAKAFVETMKNLMYSNTDLPKSMWVLNLPTSMWG